MVPDFYILLIAVALSIKITTCSIKGCRPDLFQNGAGLLHFVDCSTFINENKRSRKPSHTKLVLQEGMSIYINTKTLYYKRLLMEQAV